MKPMTPGELDSALSRLGLTWYALAQVLGLSTSAVYRWRNGRAAIPPPVALIVRAYIEHGGILPPLPTVMHRSA